MHSTCFHCCRLDRWMDAVSCETVVGCRNDNIAIDLYYKILFYTLYIERKGLHRSPI